MKPKFAANNDGALTLSHGLSARGTFGQPVNVTDASSLEIYATVQFSRMSIRAQDIEFAEQSSFSLDSKVRVRNVEALAIGDIAVVQGKAYRVGQFDRSNDLRDAFLYLEEVR